jgi:hypothetical protein
VLPSLEEGNAIHSAGALGAVASAGQATVQDLVDLSNGGIRGRILSELSYAELMQEDCYADSTWSLFYYLGIATRHGEPSMLRTPNNAMRLLVSAGVLNARI